MPDTKPQNNDNRKRLFLLDAYALIFRAFYAFIKNPRINSQGMDTSAVFGFLNTLMDLIRREKPDHLAVAFDLGGSKERSELFEEYKANRLATPEGILVAVPYIKKILEAMHIPIIELEGWEADDLIGTLAKQAEKQGYDVYMVTADKDFAQLVDKHIFLYKPSRMGNGIEIWDVNKVKEKFGVEHPEQVIDFLGMMGDSVDNIPGLPGVGEKTAKKFLAEFGSMENLLANTDKLKGKMKEKVEANKELGLLSKKLATINTQAPIKFDENEYELNTPDFDKVNQLFKELEFRRIAEQFNRLFKKPGIENVDKTADKKQQKTQNLQYSLFDDFDEEEIQEEKQNFNNWDKFYQSLDTPKAKELLFEKLQQTPEATFTLLPEQFDFNIKKYRLAVGFNAGKIYHFALENQIQKQLFQIKDFVQNTDKNKTGYDLKEFYKLLSYNGLELNGNLYDVLLIHYLLNPEMRNDIEILAENYLNLKIQKPGKKSTLQEQIDFALLKADISLRLKEKLLNDLEKSEAKSLYLDLEMPLMKVLGDMELAGIKLDVNVLQEIDKQLQIEIKRLEQEIFDQAGEEFNIGSPKQLGIILFEKLGLDNKAKKTKTGQYSTSEEVLKKYKNKFTIIDKILEWRSLTKLKSTYIDSLPKQINPLTGRIHTHFNQAVTATGRLSSTDPNLQNIPIRTEWGRTIRKAFVAEEGNILVSADYSQIELRLIASFSKDEEMLKAFRAGEDIHIATASKVFDIPIEQVTKEQRSHAKSVNYGIIYGLSAHGLSQQTGLSRSESKQLIDTYFETYPTLKKYIAGQVDKVRQKGYAETILGRRRYLRDIDSRNAIVRAAAERNAVNAPLQGSAADIIKKAMIEIQAELKQNYKTKMLLQVHDELVFEVPENELDEIKNLIKDKMENVVKLDVPLTVDIGVGKNWFEAH